MELLRSGNLTLAYDNGAIRRISHGETEVVRMIYFALRAHDWSTIPHRITNEQISKTKTSFHINFTCTNVLETTEIIHWQVQINGDENSVITFAITGEGLSDFMKNRAGFCILHPLRECKGTPVEITHPDGTKSKGNFPVLISPTNPFKDIRVMQWQCESGWFNISVEGDIFETEDQRNWADGSFKTFCTPQDLPFPVKIRKGDIIKQKITLRPVEPLLHVPDSRGNITLEATRDRIHIPRIGIAACSDGNILSEKHISLLKDLRLHHYRIDVKPSDHAWVSEFSRQYEEAFTIGVPLEVTLHLSNNFIEEAEAFVQLCYQNKVRLYKVLIVAIDKPVTPDEIIAHIHPLKSILLGVLVGAGTDLSFKDINRNRFGIHGFDFISYTVHPQEHLTDDITLFDNLESQSDAAVSALDMYTVPVHVSPVTLAKRTDADARLQAHFGAAWTLGSILQLAEGQAESITCHQAIGSMGVISSQGESYPVYEVLKKMNSLRNEPLIRITSTRPRDVQAVGAADRSWIFVANLTPEVQEVTFRDKTITMKAYETKVEISDRA